ncbi:CHAP domain-containing protein [Nonomuraea sp. CA-143628]|uniref:CHAP domain-containing protein n=1 Tax=Nonomuraea sp. CA-143628 TaxID=3239997 RepID=UPI003D9489B9
MTPEMKKYIDLLESQLGYSEKADEYTKFGHWYGKNVEFDADYTSAPWCDMYLSWAAHKLGYQDWIGQFAWTVQHAEWFKEQGAWGHKPKPGALVFYDWSGSNDIDAIDHVGVVTRVEGDKIFTIEGNIDGGVAKRKERDTSKVVGYGYPEKIKTRLENEATKNQVEGEWDAQHRATEQTSTSETSTTEVGKLQLPDGTPLVDMIPRIGQGGAPLAARPKQATPQQSAAPAPTATRKSSPAATTKAAEQAPKKGKHAKPATADTNAVTNTAPIPVIVDASSSAPVPTLSSPALIGSALVAALAVLAVAKTRQLRVRPVRAAAVAAPAARSTGPATRHRHRRKARTDTAPVLVGAGTSTDVLVGASTSVGVTTPSTDVTIPATTHLELVGSTAVPAELSVLAAVRPEPVEPIAALLSIASIPIPEATTAFDAFSSTRETTTAAFDTVSAVRATTAAFDAFAPVRETTTPFDAFTPSARRAATPHHLGSRSGARSSATARRVSAASQHPGGRTPYTRATEPWPAPGETHSPQTSGYYGRRRRSGHPIEEPAPFTSEGPLRGRRHRSPAPHPTEGFTQDSAPHGRRHRSPLAAPSHLELFGTEPFDPTLHGRRHRSHETVAPTSLAVGGDDERAARRTGDDRLQTAAHTQGSTLVEAPAPRKPGSRRGRHRA